MKKKCMNTVKGFLFTLLISTMVFSQNRVDVRATSVTALQAAAYVFDITFESSVSSNAKIEIEFPKEFNLDQVIMADSDAFDGELLLSKKNNIVVIERSKAQTDIPAGTPIDLKLASVIHPENPDSAPSFNITLVEDQREIVTVSANQVQQLNNPNR